MNVLYLYAKIPPYQIPVIKELVENYKVKVHVVFWDTHGNAPFEPPKMNNVYFYARSKFNYTSLKQLTLKINPQVIFISGWQDLTYLPIVVPFKLAGIPVVVGFDDIWSKKIRQKIGSFIFPVFRMLFYSHAWVSGPRQYEFSKRLGFKDSNIIYYLYSGDTKLFSNSFLQISRVNNYPKKFLFVGRFVHDKAIDILAEAFDIYKNKYNGQWKLMCIGTGELKYHLENTKDLEVFGYLTQEEIIKELENIGAFILPSRFDVSPLVVHEFASAGLPLILSENIGNRLLFLIDRFNGYVFNKNSASDLARKMDLLSNQSTENLLEMGKNSHHLSLQHNYRFVAASLMSVVKSKN
jgi:glycosyltransferase involved in cell wall biosynthesis